MYRLRKPLISDSHILTCNTQFPTAPQKQTNKKNFRVHPEPRGNREKKKLKKSEERQYVFLPP